MPDTSPRTARVTRRVVFSAAHRYHRPEWDEARNLAVFGDNVKLHGHNYALEATVAGEVDEQTGMSVDLGRLDRALGALAGKLGYRDLSQGVEGLEGRIPTTENLAALAWRDLKTALPDLRLVRVRLFESPELWVELGEEPR